VPACAHGDKQGRVKPAAILVAAFKIKVGRPRQIRLMAQDGGLAGARLKPYVDDVSFFAEGRAAAPGTFGPAGQNVFCFFCVPGVRAFTRKEFDYRRMRFL